LEVNFPQWRESKYKVPLPTLNVHRISLLGAPNIYNTASKVDSTTL
jgi:hypothetical protein